jgi:DNA-binding NarL/FixJ family response regulator
MPERRGTRTHQASAQSRIGRGGIGQTLPVSALVTLVAQGRSDAQIAAQLYTGIRAVRSHLDRIRNKTGCPRRADLTCPALAEGLV